MTRQDFKQITYIKRRIGDLKERRKELQAAAERLTINLTGMPSAHSGADQMANYAAQVDEIDSRILEETLKMERLKLGVEDAIESLPAQQKLILHLRYIEGLSWYKVARASNYSIDHCRKIERTAINNTTKYTSTT